MARPGVTREQVFEAAEALVLKGEAATVVAVRNHLGGGSPNTITPHLSEWKAQHENKKPEALPPLPEPVEGAMRQVWGAAWKGAQEQLEGEREALGKAREGIEKERAEMLAEISRLDSALEEAQGETRKTGEVLESERRGHDQTRAEAREAKAIAAERDRRIDDQGRELADVRRQASEATSKVSALDAEVSHLRRNLESAQAATRSEAEARAEDRRKADLVVRELDQTKRDLADASEATERAEVDLAQARSQLAELQQQRNTVVAELKEVQAANERLSGSLDREKETTKQAKTALDAGGKKIAKLEAALEEERQARTAADNTAADLRVQVATLTERAAHVDELRRLLEQAQKSAPKRKTTAKKAQAKPAGTDQEDQP